MAALGRNDYQLLRTAAIELKGSLPTAPVAAGLLEALRRVTAERKETSRDTRLALLERLQELGSADQAGALVPLLRDFDLPVAQGAAAVIQGWDRQVARNRPASAAQAHGACRCLVAAATRASKDEKRQGVHHQPAAGCRAAHRLSIRAPRQRRLR